MPKVTREIIKDVPLYQIKSYSKNYQDHNKNVDHIANSIKDFGYNKVSITVDENMEMLTGHGTWLALEKLKHKQVPIVLKITGLSENQKKAFRIADNESSKAVDINNEFLRLELDDIGIEFNMSDYGLNELTSSIDIPEIIEEAKEKTESKYYCPHCSEALNVEDLIKIKGE